MGKKRLSADILDARGAFKNHPERKRVDAKSSKPFPRCAPSHLDPLQVKCWHEIRKAVPDGILCLSDSLTVELCAILLAEMRRDSAKMQSARIGRLQSAYSELGLSPAARAKLAVTPGKKGTGFEDV